jgi:cell wall assembly regulator SMI1
VLEDPAAEKSALAGVAEPTAADVPAMWTRLEAALSKADEGNAEFAGPATVEQLAALETKTGLMLPDDLKASYGVHDGQDESSEGIYASGDFLDGAFYLMSLEQIANEWSMWKKLVDGGEFRGQESAPDDGIRSDCWNPGWLPILSDGGGDSLCVDLAPTARGVRGQIIKMSHDSAQRPLLARSFAGFLAQLIDSWEAKSET